MALLIKSKQGNKGKKAAVIRRWKKIKKGKLKKIWDKLSVSLIILVHTAISFAVLSALEPGNLKSTIVTRFFNTIHLSADTFFANFFIQGVIAYLSLYAVSSYFGRPKKLKQITSFIFCISFILSILLSSDKPQTSDSSYPAGFWAVAYKLLTEKSALLLIFVITFIGIIYCIYYLIRSLFIVTYTGSGMQIQLPGYTSFYLPIYPQISWQNTCIPVKEGETLEIEISGYVSPGILDENNNPSLRMKGFVDWIKNGSVAGKWKDEFLPSIWPYTGPEGYSKSWYGKDEKKAILKKHPLYGSKDYYFEEDKFLTVRGLPHNIVLGFVQGSGDGKPLEANYMQPAYDWRTDHEKLYNISDVNYPINIRIKKTGILWVVINDVDMARWDNGGLFFMKVTKKRWFGK